MKKRHKIKESFFKVIYLLCVSCLFMACNDDIDNTYSRNHYNLDLTSSSKDVVLNESTPDETALTVEWTPATNMGSEYIITYLYQVDLVGEKPTGAGDAIKQYEDDEIFKRSYTHKELQELLVDNWLQLTSTSASVKFTVTATFEGPRLVTPEVSTVTVKLKTYGPKQFLADKLFMSGTAVGENDIELTKSATNPMLYVYNGELSAGTINFPIVYGDEVKENAISPLTAQQDITDEPMETKVESKDAAGVWNIKQADKYRVSVNLANKTVTIVPAGDIIDVEKIFLAGTALDEEIELAQTLEDADIFAFKGELKAGSLYLPILFEGEKALSIVPNASGNQNIDDGNTVGFAQNDTDVAEGSNHWNITTAGTYRIVVNIDTKTIAIYSSAKDLQNKKVSWNNTVIGQNPFISEVDALWMYGAFNAFAGDGNGFTGFHDKYKLVQSLANPYVFVYKGDVLPRETRPDDYDKQSYTGAIRFAVSNIHNNVYAYGSTADAQRNVKNGYLSVTSGTPQTLKEGQGDNRYAFFLLPENTNYVMVDIQNLVVIFDNR